MENNSCHPFLINNFEDLITFGKLGINPFTSRNVTATKTCEHNGNTYNYQYLLKIPYASKVLNWKLMFTPTNMAFAPDFFFNDDTFHMSWDIKLIHQYIPSLVNWNVRNSKSLTAVLHEFLNLYKKQHVEKLQKENRFSALHAQYEALLEDVAENDIEVFVDGSSAHFLVRVEVNTTSLPEFIQRDGGGGDYLVNPGEDYAILKIGILKADISRVNVSLGLSPRLDQILSGKPLAVPPYQNHSTLPKYVQSIKNYMQDVFEAIKSSQLIKREYMNYLASVCATNLVKVDMKLYNTATILCEVNEYSCFVTIELGDAFPEVKPVVKIHSLFCMGIGNKPCCREVEDYPYSPRWTGKAMFGKLFASLHGNIISFKSHKHNN